MFFGMCNSPATFQAMMDSIFSDMIEGQKVIVYMDDILIFAENQEELQERTKQVLQHLREHDLFLKPKKCEFNKTTMEYLGLIIQKEKLSMDPIKLSGIQDWPTPTTIKQVRGFIGFANFYRRFIKKFSELVLPLNNLLRKDAKFDWNNQCQEAFETLKGRFSQEPVLMMPVMSTPDALPTEIALIALLLSKFQVYSTSLRHYYHRLITFSVNYTPHGINQYPAIISQEVLLSIGLAPYTRTVQPHTTSVTWSSIATSSLDFYQFPRAYFHFNRMCQESWDPLMAVLRPSSIIMKQLSE
jgi:Reverse transcriptase (RNA-dependent DNA polymerase)